MRDFQVAGGSGASGLLDKSGVVWAAWDLRYSRHKIVRRWTTRNQRNSRVALFRAQEN